MLLRYDDYQLEKAFKETEITFLDRHPNKEFSIHLKASIHSFCIAKPRNYVCFGPYWWAVKNIMKEFFDIYQYGDENSSMAIEYSYTKNPTRGFSDIVNSMSDNNPINEDLTLFAGLRFATLDYGQFSKGISNDEFQLKRNSRLYQLFDPNFENAIIEMN
ncbi:hypothetical protein [Rodentibacter pneumotropicus]|uniref:Uncharacterized protein n=1 Tax=Rodentibacter pneumotropicus TaxID=758 RepID=A0A4S2QL03_9PAST|nr:hypothetical protein [Rodentibacter pneumotropicus]THA18031.1 hypothetical protein D3M76_00235 [Rodentibacter pneumotropicus]